MLGVFAHDALGLWLGSDFATESSRVLQILGIGVLFNSLAQIPYTLLQGVGRPDVPAKFHLLELPLYVGIAWFLINRWGITGAAASWALRVTLDAALLFGAAFQICRLSKSLLRANSVMVTFLAVVVLGAGIYTVRRLLICSPLVIQVLIVLGFLACFAWFCWCRILEQSEREGILKGIKP
ncbi:polysaccharide biosynthesis C-terminal domain-containing protein [Thermanaeromonas sp. C210]|uniref:polysaccharide biosynthesis C-terminal domain-containing protein n=1 Tax=Thermanaeromonas sp. C210 TaxID=2731925 RepID=UPI0020B7FCCC|nr:polysaccharide biosynthesis C-terminal domain-containing protein [Thermanaeromonas sp. C210]